MLEYLRIRNLAVIEEVALELGPGLTVLTGETGAGKSIIIDGLALAAGERASLDQIRTGAEEAEVEASFTVSRDPAVRALLEAAGLDGGRQVVVRRVLTPTGSRAYLNDRLVTLQQLKAVGDRLVDLHGQHPHQSLLSVGAHRELLDRFAGNGELLEAVARAYREAVAVGDRLAALRMDERQRAQRLDLLRFQLDEIRAAAPRPGEDEGLEAERRRLVHAEELAAAGAEVVGLLYEAEESATALMHRAERRLARLLELDPEAPAGLEPLQEARYAVEELARRLQGYLEGVQVDPERLAEVDERLAVLRRLQRKYGDTLEEVLEAARAMEVELEELDSAEEQIGLLERQLRGAAEAYRQAAAELGERRRRAAAELRRRVEEELHGLAMEAARFQVRVGPRQGRAPEGLPAGASPRGSERVEFLLAANPGEEPRPLARVASGGELSRVMLALKLVATDGDPMETLVFDEVDAGIGGGRAAERLAQRLASLGRTHQVLVVSHLPQVAAYADRHVAVRKFRRRRRVIVEARPLRGADVVEELARMLGGLRVTEASRRHARELLASRR